MGGGPLSERLGNGSKEWEVSAPASLEQRREGCAPDLQDHASIAASSRGASVFAHCCVSVHRVADFLLDGTVHHRAPGRPWRAICPSHESLAASDKSRPSLSPLQSVPHV